MRRRSPACSTRAHVAPVVTVSSVMVPMSGSSMTRVASGLAWKAGHDLAGEALQLLEIVVAGGQDHVLDARLLQVGDPLHDLPCRAQEVRLLQLLEGAVRAHHALEARALQGEGLLAVVRVHEMSEVQVSVAEAGGIPS